MRLTWMMNRLDRLASGPLLLAVLALSCGIAAVGCAGKNADLADPQGVTDAAQPAPSESNEAPTPEPEPEPELDPEAVAPADPDLWDLDEGELLPWEMVTDSPLDMIAEVLPDLSEVELAAERQRLLDEAQPEFDIPIEINDKVLFWLDYYSNRHPDQFLPGMRRSGRYMAMFRRIFEEEGVPLDLIPMAHVESAFKTNAYSRARAMGVWQFISSTGRHYGLEIDYWVDERRDPEKAARAAAHYLRDMHDEFGDWYLALAGYNGGEGRVRRSLARSDQDDFWGITRYLRRETRNYVPAIIAATMIYKEPAKYGLEYTPDPEVRYDTVEVDGAVDLQVLADCAGADFETMELLNPMLRRAQTPPNAKTDIRVPVGAVERTIAALENVPQSERVLFVHHKVRSGDTLYDLARKYDVTVGAIQQANNLGRSTTIRIGRELTIPTVAAGRYSSLRQPQSTTPSGPVPVGAPFTYRVRRGETLSHIAKRYRTTSAAIAAVSDISVNKVLQIGERVTVVPGARSQSTALRAVSGEIETTSVAASGSKHQVRRGESLWLIARQYRTTVDQLCSLNSISKSAILQPGTMLIIAP